MNDKRLEQALDRVAARQLRVNRLWRVTALCVAAAAAVGAFVAPGLGIELGILAAGSVAAAAVLQGRRKHLLNRMEIARRLEHKFPDLDTRLLAAMGEPVKGQVVGGYLQQELIEQTLRHDAGGRWGTLVPGSAIGAARICGAAGVGLLAGALLFAGMRMNWGGASQPQPAKPAPVVEAPFEIKVEPRNADIEKNTPLVVVAHFGIKRIPADVKLLTKTPDGKVNESPMSKSLADPLFAGRVEAVNKDLQYAVKYGNEQTGWYTAKVFEYPELKQADADLKYPEYTHLAEKKIEDTRSVTAVEGTKTTFSLHLNKPVATAELTPVTKAAGTQPAATEPESPIVLTRDATDPTLYTATVEMKHSEKLALRVTDDAKRANRNPAELTLNVTVNRPADLKMVFPGHDVDVSPLQEVTLKASAWDDFGIKRMGVTYSLGGGEPVDETLAENVEPSKDAKDRKEVTAVIPLEKLKAEPDQLLSYHFWAEDTGPDGKPRRIDGDMYFAEVRPFEEIFRQGEQQTAEQQAQQQREQQQGQQGGQNGQRAEQLAEMEKEVIAATWKVMRREEPLEKLSDAFVPDVKLIEDSQGQAAQQASALAEKLTDAKSQSMGQQVVKDMGAAQAALHDAQGGDGTAASAAPLKLALSSEQAAYQDLLKLRAHEFDVSRQQGQQGQQGQNSAQQRRQQQLDQLDASNEQNRYETQRAAQQQQQPEDPAQAEARQVLSRLRELAQRQGDLNQQMKELQAALQKAQDAKTQEDLQRQLARLRDQQQQLLRDTDELRDRMNQPENKEQMANASQQLEQTRENVRQAGEQLAQNQVQQAQASGQRAQEQLSQLRDEVRQQAAGQFTEAMNNLQQQAKALDDKQGELQQQLAANEAAATQPAHGLRDDNAQQRDQIASSLDQQKKDLGTLTQNMQKTIEQSETPEPLLSRQLYDTMRQAAQQHPDQALQTAQDMVKSGVLDQAKTSNETASAAISQLRQGIDKASQSVLGSDTESLKRAAGELGTLAQQLQRENPNAAATQPAGQLAAGGAATQPNRNALAAADTQPGTRPAGEAIAQAAAATQPGQANPQQATGGDRQLAQAGNTQDRQLGQAGNPQNPAGQNGERQTAGQNAGQPQERQTANGQQPQNGQPGGQPRQQNEQPGGQPAERRTADAGARAGQQGQQGQPGQQGEQGQQANGQRAGQQGQQGEQGQQANGERGGQGGQRGQQGQQGEQGQQANGQRAGQNGQQGQQGQQGEQGQQANGQRGGQNGQQGQQGEQGQQANGQRGGQGGEPGQQGQQGEQGQQANGQRGGQGGERGQQGQQGEQGQQANGQQPGDQPGQGGRGQRGGRGQGQAQEANGQQPGQQPGQGGQQPGQPGQQPGLAQGPGRAGGRGGQNPQANPQPTDQQAQANPQAQPGNGQNGNAPRQPGDVPPQGGIADNTPGTMPAVPRGQPRDTQGGVGGSRQRATADAPITGDGFREWSDRMRDVEEMVNDPALRAQAAAIREQAAALRADAQKNGGANWNTVDETIGKPLAQLRQAVSDELLRRESAQPRVPIDKEPVPAAFADDVKRYYERLGSGK